MTNILVTLNIHTYNMYICIGNFDYTCIFHNKTSSHLQIVVLVQSPLSILWIQYHFTSMEFIVESIFHLYPYFIPI